MRQLRVSRVEALRFVEQLPRGVIVTAISQHGAQAAACGGCQHFVRMLREPLDQRAPLALHVELEHRVEQCVERGLTTLVQLWMLREIRAQYSNNPPMVTAIPPKFGGLRERQCRYMRPIGNRQRFGLHRIQRQRKHRIGWDWKRDSGVLGAALFKFFA